MGLGTESLTVIAIWDGVPRLNEFIVNLCMLKTFASFAVCIALTCLAQFSFSQQQYPAVTNGDGDRSGMLYPWAGGMNSCQFGRIDINLDGVPDLVVFDRFGNRIMPFISAPGTNSYGYNYAPEFAENFPELSDWAIFADYDGDGKTDIFTYSPGYAGMKVYRNVSGAQLEFQLEVFPYLKTFQAGGYVNILVTYADYPAISDLDGDGDLDILTFWGLGSFVEMHRNMSVEKYGNRDSLDYVKTESCWGYFAESIESNAITLDTCLGGLGAWGPRGMDDGIRHTGSTFQVIDLNGDGLPDLLLGDVDYPNVIALYNGGTSELAKMTSYEWNFPENDQPIDLYSMPSVFYDDIDHDIKKDLLVSPFDPNTLNSANLESAWAYINQGDDSFTQFKLQNKSFLQDEMLDVGAGAYAVFADFDSDGLLDLFIGNFGKYDTSYYDQYLILHTINIGSIALLRNTGTLKQPQYAIVSNDFAGIAEREQTGVIPSFGDLDGDGDSDMITGNSNGKLSFFRNDASAGSPMDMSFLTDSYQGIDVGDDSAPALFDLDGDGLLDIVIGEKGGNLNYYHNSGTASAADFQLATDSLGKVNVTDYSISLSGYSVPSLFIDSEGHIQLLVGSEQGKIFYYPDIDDNINGAYKESPDLGILIGIAGFNANRGYRTAAALSDIDQDGIPDLIAGNFSGGLEYFSKGQDPGVIGITDPDKIGRLISIFPNPTSGDITITASPDADFNIAMVEIFDVTGRKVNGFSSFADNFARIDIGSLADGIYFARITVCLDESHNSVQILKKVLKKTKYK
jgi:hypothetical protein